MISILITSYKESRTIGKAIEAFNNQKIKENYEILVASPDFETGTVVMKYASMFPNIRWIQDKRKGKPAAINLLLKEAKGDILFLSDGDVYVSDNSVNDLLEHFKDPKVGIVSGRPVSLSPKNTMLGYWSHLLTNEAAHATRIERTQKGEFIVCSGYLFAIRKKFQYIPEDLLSEDAIMSHLMWQKGYKTNYEPKAEVYVKYPTNFKDWIIQKKRSAGGYQQISKYFKNPPIMRSFSKEIINGWYKPLKYASNTKEFIWSLALYPARLYLWLKIFMDINNKHFNLLDIWKPVESTK
ncbi:glycosyltransferase [Candidatus Woesearchaeota archaeon]|nr:glycosyltransferase [Candidatus Woesearchaeota archaeon]